MAIHGSLVQRASTASLKTKYAPLPSRKPTKLTPRKALTRTL